MSYFGIFVEDVDAGGAEAFSPDSEDAPPYAGLPKTPRPLQNENFMGDVVTIKVRQNQPFKFVFKRKIFLKSNDPPSDDPMFERLVYLQARRGRGVQRVKVGGASSSAAPSPLCRPLTR